jgi:hypothetical protein
MINIERGLGGRVYQIWKQQQACSCGVACAWMRADCEADELCRRRMGIGPAYLSRLSKFGTDRGEYHSQRTDDDCPSCLPQYSSQSATETTSAPTSRAQGSHVPNSPTLCVTMGCVLRCSPITVRPLRWSRTVSPTTGRGFPSSNGRRVAAPHFVVVGRCTAHHVTFLDPVDWPYQRTAQRWKL